MIGPAVDGARLRRNPAATGRWALALGVFFLAVGVVAMHVLGSGHHPVVGAAPSVGVGHASHSGATGSPTAAGLAPSLTEQSTPVGPVVGMASMVASATTAQPPGCPGCEPVSAGGSAVSHTLMAVCLAVIPLVLVMLRPWRRAWYLSRKAVGRQRAVVRDAAWFLSRIDTRRPSLEELCILRT